MERTRAEILSELRDRILPFWQGLRDEKNGGFIGRVDFDLTRHPEADKGCILNSRILWFFGTKGCCRTPNAPTICSGA